VRAAQARSPQLAWLPSNKVTAGWHLVNCTCITSLAGTTRGCCSEPQTNREFPLRPRRPLRPLKRRFLRDAESAGTTRRQNCTVLQRSPWRRSCSQLTDAYATTGSCPSRHLDHWPPSQSHRSCSPRNGVDGATSRQPNGHAVLRHPSIAPVVQPSLRCACTHLTTSRCPFSAAPSMEQRALVFSSSHCNTARCPPDAAPSIAASVHASDRCACSHFTISKCPFDAPDP